MLNAIFNSYPNKPTIPVRVPNDDTTFNPKEYPNVIFSAKGKLSGKVFLVHGGSETDETGLGRISTRVWVVTERDREDVSITPKIDNGTFTFFLQTPEDYTSHNFYHETTIQYPRSTTSVESLLVMAPSTSFSGDNLATLTFRSIKSTLSNGSISLEPIHSDIVKLQTSNANISGVFEAGHVDLSSSNGSISVELNMKDAIDGEQSKVLTQTSNASIDMHVTATETSHGLWMKILTRNDRISVGALIGKADRASSINASTSNAKINFNVDASQTGQALEIVNKTTNGGIVSSVMAPKDRPLKGIAESSNASISVNLTEEFEGKFRLETSNASTIVEGTHLVLEHDKTYLKNGYRIKKGPSEFTALSSNGSAALRFYPAGLSSASA